MVKKLKLEELHRVDVATFKNMEKIPVVVVLDNIRSMHNVGAVFRSSDAFIIEKIVLCGITPCPPHREINKSAIGATESVDWEYENNIDEALQKLKNKGYKTLGIEQTTASTLLQDYPVTSTEKYALVFGNEVGGLSEQALPLCDVFLEIPQRGTKHSLNISVCTGIVLWHFFKTLGV